jgi:hypothetical protein
MVEVNLVTIDKVRAICNQRGWWFPATNALQIDYNCFVFGVRSVNREHSADAFDDIIGVIYPLSGVLRMELFAATTDPSARELIKPSFPEAQRGGTAILVEGQYRGAYQLGTHGAGTWRHQALVQVRPLKIYRDANRDEILNLNPAQITEGNYGINIHMAHPTVPLKRISGYSAGCQVVQDPPEYQRFMFLCGKQREEINKLQRLGGDRFSYTLILEQWLS